MASTNTNVSDITKTFTSFGGCDIYATFNGITIGEISRITYSISREKTPNYTMGDANPKSFTRGRRGIAGTLSFLIFNRDAFYDEMILTEAEIASLKEAGTYTGEEFASPQILSATANTNGVALSMEEWDAAMTKISRGDTVEATRTNLVENLATKRDAAYADEIMPFDITLSMANEYGSRSVQEILGVEIMNAGGGYANDSSQAEVAYTYLARGITPVRSLSSETFKATF